MTYLLLQKNKIIKHKAIKIICQLEVKAKRNQLENIRLFRAINGNETKLLKNRQKIYTTTRAGGKTAEKAIKK